MVEYSYKGFKIFYEIKPINSNLYCADGHVICSVDPGAKAPSQKFHTEYSTLEDTQEGIRRLIEEYIDFEWAEFHELDNNNP